MPVEPWLNFTVDLDICLPEMTKILGVRGEEILGRLVDDEGLAFKALDVDFHHVTANDYDVVIWGDLQAQL